MNKKTQEGTIGWRPSLPNIADRETFWEGVILLEGVVGGSGYPGLACYCWDYCLVGAYLGFFDQAAGEDCSQDSLVIEVFVQLQLALGVEGGHFGACACSAW